MYKTLRHVRIQIYLTLLNSYVGYLLGVFLFRFFTLIFRLLIYLYLKNFYRFIRKKFLTTIWLLNLFFVLNSFGILSSEFRLV